MEVSAAAALREGERDTREAARFFLFSHTPSHPLPFSTTRIPSFSFLRQVVPGETALAFYTAYNPTDKPITGVSTYNITPMRAGLYFNKIQCFCFEEQRLRPHEEVDMPVFFYVDPAFLDDPAMDTVKSITLSYTFFRTGEQEVVNVGGSASTAAVVAASAGKPPVEDGPTSDRVRKWTEEMAAKTGLAASLPGGKAAPAAP